MMRELKFRPCDGKKVYKPFDLSDTLHEKIEPTELWDDEIFFLEWTSLVDKHGTEIYEGDLVESQINENKWRYEVRFNPEAGEMEKVTRWRNFAHDEEIGQYIWGDYFTDEYSGSVSGLKYCEVIGNIYENPELLEKVKD